MSCCRAGCKVTWLSTYCDHLVGRGSAGPGCEWKLKRNLEIYFTPAGCFGRAPAAPNPCRVTLISYCSDARGPHGLPHFFSLLSKPSLLLGRKVFCSPEHQCLYPHDYQPHFSILLELASPVVALVVQSWFRCFTVAMGRIEVCLQVRGGRD
jgi:hypothetical protein